MKKVSLKISENDVAQISNGIRDITETLKVSAKGGRSEAVKEICSMDVAEMFCWPHTKVFNMIARYVTVNATQEEKKEFRFDERIYRQGARKHSVCYLTGKGSAIFLDKICADECRKSKRFQEGAEKLRKAIAKAEEDGEDEEILMDGRSRAECQKIMDLFDRFITGPGLEKREIAELTEKYSQFYDVLKRINIKTRESNEIETAVYGVAIEAEMQGFIYGFKLHEELMNRSVVVA